MTDTITLPREVVEKALEALGFWDEFRWGNDRGAVEALRTHLAAEQPKHPGYIIGSHWLETAYSRICAGEAEADVLRDCGWERVDDAEALRRDAERLNAVALQAQNAAIDLTKKNERLREALEMIAGHRPCVIDGFKRGFMPGAEIAKAALRREEVKP